MIHRLKRRFNKKKRGRLKKYKTTIFDDDSILKKFKIKTKKTTKNKFHCMDSNSFHFLYIISDGTIPILFPIPIQ